MLFFCSHKSYCTFAGSDGKARSIVSSSKVNHHHAIIKACFDLLCDGSLVPGTAAKEHAKTLETIEDDQVPRNAWGFINAEESTFSEGPASGLEPSDDSDRATKSDDSE